MFRKIFLFTLLLAAIVTPLATRIPEVAASSHREAPLIVRIRWRITRM
jgi:hypothetical protein